MEKIIGRKGGQKKGHTPVESPDSLQSLATAKILLALGEGEFAGGITADEIYLDGTPIGDGKGGINFPGVTYELRYGTEDQRSIKGMPEVTNPTDVKVELREGSPWFYDVTRAEASAVRIMLSVPALMEQKDNGDIVGYKVDYNIAVSTDGGSYQTAINTSFNGKTTNEYQRTHRIELPDSTANNWRVRVTRTTPNNQGSAKIQDTTRIETVTEVIDAKLRYPNTALLFVTFDAKQFNNIPQISVKAKGRKIRVPDNYDPVSRTYDQSTIWKGQFKWAYSNNPAWVFYDIVLDKRFGLGNRIDASMVDIWELYQIGVYCDTPVWDGSKNPNSKEPRFLCDVYIQDQNEAFNVLRDLASIFRGMTYYAKNQLFALADMPRDMSFIYTRANVIDGKFTYSSGSERNRCSTAMVSWSNPANHYADEIEAVAESDLIRRYGVRQTNITAIGCTRKTEANRRGRWALLTNARDRMVTFSTGLDGFIPLPGYVIGVADPMLAGKVLGGRISSATSKQVIILDRTPEASPGDRFHVNMPDGKPAFDTIQKVEGNKITLTGGVNGLKDLPESQAVWSVENDKVTIQTYRVTSINDNDDGTFTITAIYYNESKYAAIDNGARVDLKYNISQLPLNVIAPPADVNITSTHRVMQGIAVETMRINWKQVHGAIAYEIQWQKDNGDWVNAPRTSSLGIEIPGIYSGEYIARVRSINPSDVSSQWAYSPLKELKGKVGEPPMPAAFRTSSLLWGIKLEWDFPEGTADTLQTQIRYIEDTGAKPADNLDENLDHLLTDVPYPQKNYSQIGLQAGVAFWYRARLVDKIGNHSNWTAWTSGKSSSDAIDYLGNIDNAVKSSEAWKELNDKIVNINPDAGTNIERDLELVSQQVENFYEERKDFGQAFASIKEIRQVVADEKEQMALEISRLEAANAANDAKISQESKARTDDHSAVATQLRDLQAKVGTDVLAQIQSEVTARTTAEKALGQRIDGISATLGTQKGNIDSLAKTVADNQTATSKTINEVIATANGAKAGVSTNATAIASVNKDFRATWMVQVQGAGSTADPTRIAGMYLSSDKKGSDFVVVANKFAVYNNAGKSTLPFAVVGGQVFINNAMIGKASISMAQIQTEIKSGNYSVGRSGWSLNSNTGVFEMNANNGSGTMIFNGSSITVKDAKGYTRVKMGLF